MKPKQSHMSLKTLRFGPSNGIIRSLAPSLKLTYNLGPRLGPAVTVPILT